MKIFFVAPTHNKVGLTSVALGIVRAFERQGIKVGFLRPIAEKHTKELDSSVHFARQLSGSFMTPDPISLEEVEQMLSVGEEEELMEKVVALAHETFNDDLQVLIVEGVTMGDRNPYANKLNADLARNLEAEVILVSSLRTINVPILADELEIVAKNYKRSDGSGLAGCVFNFTPIKFDFGGFMSDLRSNSEIFTSGKLPLLGFISENKSLALYRTIDIANYLGAKIINPGEINTRRIESTIITAQSVPGMVERNYFAPNALIVTPGDREDVVMAASLAHLNGVPLAGILYTSDILPDKNIQKLCGVALESTLPVMQVKTNSYETATRIYGMEAMIPYDDVERMEKSLDFIADRIDIISLSHRIKQVNSLERRLPPSAFRFELIQRAKAAAKRIVLPEGDEPRTVQAAIRCVEKNIAIPVLLADPESVSRVTKGLGISLPDNLEIINPVDVKANYVDGMVELRKNKGMTAEKAMFELEDTVVLGTMMLAQGEVDGLVSGAIHTTANTVRPAFQLIKTAPNSSLVSSIFFMLMPEQVLVYGDAAINPNPTAEELAEIAIQSADSAKAFGIIPRVAMISYSTGSSGFGEDVEKVKRATEIVRERRPDIVIDGPLQYDAASVESVGKSKAPDSQVAGRATVFIFPDLNTGNTTYKAVQRSAGVVAVGPMLQGLNKPVNDLSRGALVDDIVYTIALTAIQALPQE